MLSAETIKEHDVRQNAGAQRLLKADGGCGCGVEKSGVKKRIVIQLSHVRLRLVILRKRNPGILGSHMMIWGWFLLLLCRAS